MKKLIMTAAIVCAAAVSYGAQMAWNANAFYFAESAKDGSFSETQIKGTTYVGLVNAVVWESATAISGLSAGDLYNAYKEGTTATLIKGASVLTGSIKGNGALNISGTASYTTGDNVYAAVLYTYADSDGNEYYIENYAQNTAAAAKVTTSDLSKYEGGTIGSSHGAALTEWNVVPVPEPTSGLLLLLGMAGLALRRRRA